jgi:hypothetical protein
MCDAWSGQVASFSGPGLIGNAFFCDLHIAPEWTRTRTPAKTRPSTWNSENR